MDKINILLVEDNVDEIELIKRALKKSNIQNEVVVTCDGAEALECIFDTKIMPDVILLDLNLPKINGLEVLKRLHANVETKNLPVFLLTTSDESEEIIECHNLGISSDLKKPVDYKDFEAAIRYISEHWRVISHTRM